MLTERFLCNIKTAFLYMVPVEKYVMDINGSQSNCTLTQNTEICLIFETVANC